MREMKKIVSMTLTFFVGMLMTCRLVQCQKMGPGFLSLYQRCMVCVDTNKIFSVHTHTGDTHCILSGHESHYKFSNFVKSTDKCKWVMTENEWKQFECPKVTCNCSSLRRSISERSKGQMGRSSDGDGDNGQLMVLDQQPLNRHQLCVLCVQTGRSFGVNLSSHQGQCRESNVWALDKSLETLEIVIITEENRCNILKPISIKPTIINESGLMDQENEILTISTLTSDCSCPSLLIVIIITIVSCTLSLTVILSLILMCRRFQGLIVTLSDVSSLSVEGSFITISDKV